jgi:hypothetical protein
MLILSLGGFFPITLAGIIVGKPFKTTAEKRVAFTEVSTNFLLEIV